MADDQKNSYYKNTNWTSFQSSGWYCERCDKIYSSIRVASIPKTGLCPKPKCRNPIAIHPRS